MNRQIEQIWAVLVQGGVVQGAAPESGVLEPPWYVKALLAFSGWLAAIFLLGFLGFGFKFLFDNSTVALIVGGIMIAAAFVILRISTNDFVEHLALAVSLAGQALIVFAIFDMSNHKVKTALLLVAILQSLLAVVMSSFVHRVFSAFVAVFALSIFMTISGLPYVVTGFVMLGASLCWLNEFRYPQHMRKIRAIGYGLVLALVQLEGTALFGNSRLDWLFYQDQSELLIQPWVGEVLIGGVTLYVVWQLLQRYGQPRFGRLSMTALLGALLLCVVSLEVQGITVGVVILLLGFAGANRVLQGLGITTLLFYISYYYLLLDVTLMEKAKYLFIVGLILLVARWLIPRILPEKKEAQHA